MAVATESVSFGENNNFDSWLNTKLGELEVDESVFSSYIRSILEDDESDDEKREGLESLLSGATNEATAENIFKHVNEILEAWAKMNQPIETPIDNTPKEDVDVRLARLLESQSLATTSHKNHYTEEDKKIRDAILAQYSQMSDDNESDGDDFEEGGGGGGGSSGLEKNTNVANIIQAQKERREQAKLESMKKKEKDKEDREKQKIMKEEKKEKRKTVKGERRR
ncbi:unnamed protein product [Trichogramma brassicae]|uniref:Coiled-coil domain-containing protein 43 n=1 Tax=Trichogramma brassicae TaxID=86971 RepID=A0A6H5HY46_9HYME|nr:unnamed protein product [Trichogramma brassicae]